MQATQKSIFPLSNTQKGVLFEILRDQASRQFYIVQMLLSIKHKIDSILFTKAFNIAINRHSVLRSAICIDLKDINKSSLLVQAQASIPVAYYDYSAFGQADQVHAFDAFLDGDLKNPIDLSHAPLMRLTFFKFNDKNYSVVWTRHHILMDGASVELVIKEVFSIYCCLLENTKPKLSKLIDNEIIHDYEKYLITKSAKVFWQKIYHEYHDIGFVPVYSQIKKSLTSLHHVSANFSESKYKKLNAFILKHHLTVNTMLQAALGIVLSNYSGKSNVIFGSVLVYPKDVVKNCVGLFINTLPVRIDINYDEKIIEYLKRIRKRSTDLKKYINVPLGVVRKLAGVPLDVPLYQCVVDYKPHSINTMLGQEFADLKCSASFKLHIPYSLVFEVINERNFLRMNLHYDAGLFTHAFASAILIYFQEILCQLMNEHRHTQKISRLPTLIPTEDQLIRKWNATDVRYPLEKTVHQLFEERVKKTPSAAALYYRNQSINYKFLNERANQLAHYLLQYSTEKETRIAICLRPGLDIIVAILAVLKAGCVYVPIDPNYPIERIQYLLQDSKPAAIITEKRQVIILQEIARQHSHHSLVIIIDEFQWGSNSYSKMNLALPMNSTDAMYIIYTSGSTGVPKGVVLEHRSVVNTALSCIDKLRITTRSRILQLASFSFDVSVAEWCMVLLGGATLYIIDHDIFSPRAIMDALKQYKITTIILSSSVLASLPLELLPDLVTIAPGGEACDQNTIHFWAKNHLLINVYGITETAICSTIAALDANTFPTIIGKPLPNTNILVLDKNLHPTPLGVPGEIYVGGVGVARGYFNNPAMTAEKFLSNIGVFVANNRKKNIFYKTGDLGRWLSTGNLEYLGRIDEQVKIRGFRVELSEVEHVLESHPNVIKAACVVRQHVGTKILYAYVIIKPGKYNVDALRQHMQSILPHYMVPAQFVEIKQFPLTPNGKVDRQKLLQLTSSKLLTKSDVDKTNALEKKIVRVIRNILCCAHVNRDKNFLDYGFNSMSLLQLASMLGEKLKQEVNIVTLFTYPTVGSLAAYFKHQCKSYHDLQHDKKVKSPILNSKRIRFSDENEQS